MEEKRKLRFEELKSKGKKMLDDMDTFKGLKKLFKEF